jgi:hypothetical protein
VITYSILIVSESGERAEQRLPVKTATAARANTSTKRGPQPVVAIMDRPATDELNAS